MVNVGKIDGPTIGINQFGGLAAVPFQGKMNDAAIANGQAFLISELEKRDPLIRTPLTSITYPRDVPLVVGGGWVEEISNLAVDYGVAGGSGDSLVHAPSANDMKVIQYNLNKDKFKAHIFSIMSRIGFINMQRTQVTGRSLDRMATDGIRLSYDKHMDQNTYIGMPIYGTYGLVNNPNVTPQNVVNGAAGTTQWATKTTEEILQDINNAILSGWAAAEYDRGAIPNHILLPYAQYNYIATTPFGALGEKSILAFLRENNVATTNGVSLFIGATEYLKGAGAGNTDRMISYVNDSRFLEMDELVPLQRAMTSTNTDAFAYDTIYVANISEVMFYYYQTVGYFDGI